MRRWITGATIVEEGTGRTWPNTPHLRYTLGAVAHPTAMAWAVNDGSVDLALARTNGAR